MDLFVSGSRRSALSGNVERERLEKKKNVDERRKCE
jgi:hypothetical protein